MADNDSASNELSLRLAANVVPAADRLRIIARRQPVGSRQFTSGYLTTVGQASWSCFRALIRARWDDLLALWPALWFRFDDAAGEIDGMEAIGTVGKLVQTAHQNTNPGMDKSGYEWAMPHGWSPSDWHVYLPGEATRQPGHRLGAGVDPARGLVGSGLIATQRR